MLPKRSASMFRLTALNQTPLLMLVASGQKVLLAAKGAAKIADYVPER
tara:strand:- start:142 stop:285 length:144 start_codon:yes stop_codon:yes gene_type:complete